MALRRFHGTESHAHNHATSATGVQKDERSNKLHGSRDDIYIYISIHVRKLMRSSGDVQIPALFV